MGRPSVLAFSGRARCVPGLAPSREDVLHEFHLVRF